MIVWPIVVSLFFSTMLANRFYLSAVIIASFLIFDLLIRPIVEERKLKLAILGGEEETREAVVSVFAAFMLLVQSRPSTSHEQVVSKARGISGIESNYFSYISKLVSEIYIS